MTRIHTVRPEQSLAKVCGADAELGNFILGLGLPGGTGDMASRILLSEMTGVPAGDRYGCSGSSGVHGASAWGWGWDDDPGWSGHAVDGAPTDRNPHSRDWGRKYLAENGGCVYIDLGHLELCPPEVLSAWDHVASWHAALRMAAAARARANARMPPGKRIEVLVNNSDRQSHSYGSHMSFLITRDCYERIFSRKLHQMLFLASFLTSAMVYTGCGKAAAENRRPEVDFQISERADFLETLTGPQTTYRRPVVNSRDEALCGDRGPEERSMARIHVIAFDNTLCQVSTLLKAGTTQIVLAMLEQEVLDANLILEDPVSAAVAWSHDPTLRTRARCVSRRDYTAVELQLAILDRARRFVEDGGAEGIVPRAGEIIELWGDTLSRLERRDMETLSTRLDWVLKHRILQRAVEQHAHLEWRSTAIKHLDLLYASLDPEEGLFRAYEREGRIQRVVTEEEIERFLHEPPDDTRAWLRAQILRRVEEGSIRHLDFIDWDTVRFRFHERRPDAWSTYRYRTLPMNNPLGFTREACEAVLEEAPSLTDALEALGMVETNDRGRPVADSNAAPHGAVVSREPRLLVAANDERTTH